MKEYRSKHGGRHLYNEDVHYLQELGLSMSEMFKSSGLNFVISGCSVQFIEGTDYAREVISDGYVYLAGKIRPVAGRTVEHTKNNGILNLQQIYICENNITTGNAIQYADGSMDEEFYDYSATIKTPSEGVTGEYIELRDHAFPDLMNTYYNKYCLVKSGADQIIPGIITFTEGLYGSLLRVSKGAGKMADMTVDTDGNLTVQLQKSGDNQYKLVFYKANGAVELYNNSFKVWSLGASPASSCQFENGIFTNVNANVGTFDELNVDRLTANIANIHTSQMDGSSGYIETLRSDRITAKIIEGTQQVTGTLVTGNTVKSNGDVWENGSKLEDIYMKKFDWNDGSWMPFIDATTGAKITGFQICNKFNLAIGVKGTLPQSYFNVPNNNGVLKYRLNIKIQRALGLTTELNAIGTNWYLSKGGVSKQIPVDGTIKMRAAFVIVLDPTDMDGHNPATDAWCVWGIGSDDYVYLLGARYEDNCTWDGTKHIWATGNMTVPRVREWIW